MEAFLEPKCYYLRLQSCKIIKLAVKSTTADHVCQLFKSLRATKNWPEGRTLDTPGLYPGLGIVTVLLPSYSHAITVL